MGVAASGAAAFYHAIIQDIQKPDYIMQADITLTGIFGTDRVHADITITAPDGNITLNGDISDITLYDGNGTVHANLAHHTHLIPEGDHIIIRYVGPLNTTKSVDTGDVIRVIIHHRFGQDVIQVRIS